MVQSSAITVKSHLPVPDTTVRRSRHNLSSAQYYRMKEAEERELALRSGTGDDRSEHNRLANRYARLARQAEMLSVAQK